MSGALSATGRRLRRDERGQVLVFGAVACFLLVGAISLVVHAGSAVHGKLRLQQAADAAALSGARIQANCLSTVAWLNDGMACVYYHACRYAVDTAVSATLAEFKRVRGPDGTLYPAPDSVVGVPDAEGLYRAAYARADEWIPRCESWLKLMSRMERAVALLAPVMIEREAYDSAQGNGAGRSMVFPKCSFFPDPDSYVRILVEQLSGGWRFTSSNAMVMAVATGEESWHIEQVEGGEHIVVDITRTGEDRFRVEYTDSTTHRTYFIDRHMVVDTDGATVTNNPDGTTTITQDGRTTTFRYTPTGVQVSTGGGWQDVPSQQSVDFNGSNVRVTNFQNVQVGRANVWPDRIVIGRTIVHFTDPVRVATYFGPVGISVRDDQAVLNGLSTARADGLWYRVWDRDDRTRHRLTQDAPTAWTYEYQRSSSYLADEVDLWRFTVEHAIKDNDAGFAADGTLPAWTAWFNPETGRSTDPGDYHQTRVCWRPVLDGTPGEVCNGTYTRPGGRPEPCPVCRGLDYDDDGRTDVRVTQEDTLDLQGGGGLQAADRQGVDLQAFFRPLVLTEDFFKFGLTVGTWTAGERFPLLSHLFPPASWGAFAVASARAGVSDGTGAGWIYNFDDEEGRREWLASYANLYEPGWTAKLYPVAEVIRAGDIDANAVDSGLNYLMRSLAAGRAWRDGYFSDDDLTGHGMRAMRSPWNGRIFDLSGTELQDVMQH